jgi:hypothetical protein
MLDRSIINPEIKFPEIGRLPDLDDDGATGTHGRFICGECGARSDDGDDLCSPSAVN